ncbi:MAG TPA: hypothetical protein GXX49_03525 [Clostridiaceae bacterium]|nr:hypothetical protein [Clostridiaceae bacterium]
MFELNAMFSNIISDNSSDTAIQRQSCFYSTDAELSGHKTNKYSRK